MFFKILGGRHSEAGKDYAKGDIVESNLNLIELFPNKFVRVEKQGSKSKTKAPAKPKNPFGKDVTKEFPDAGVNGFKVYQNKDGYTLVDTDTPDKPCNDKPLDVMEVIPLMDTFFED